jgi:hypothetical protein
MYFDAVVVEVKTFFLLLRLTLAILCIGVKEEQKSEVQINLKKKQYQNSEFLV